MKSSFKILLLLALSASSITWLQSCKPKGAQSAVSGDAASKVYIAPGKYDEFYNFVSGGFSGQMSVPSGRLLRVIPVFSVDPEKGYGYSEESKPMLNTSHGFVPWDDLHHIALSETDGIHDGRWVFGNGNNTPRIARIDLKTFRTAEIIEIPNSAGNHSSPFITENSEYVVAGTRFSIPMDNSNGDVPINTYKANFKGTVSFIAVDKTSGNMNIAFQILLPGVNFDLARAGKGKSHGWMFFSCYNSEKANTLLEVNASQKDKDFILAVNWKKAEEYAKAGKGKKVPVRYAHNIYDEQKQKAIGVRVIDANTKETTEYFADIIFVNAAALNTNLILLNSTSSRFPNGLGNDNGLLGKYVAFHNYRARISAEYDGFQEFTKYGNRPNGCYIPRFRNVRKQETDFLRGYAAGFGAFRRVDREREGVGEDLKESLLNPTLGTWSVGSHIMGETIPKETNYVSLSKDLKDAWGMPQLNISIDYDDNDEKMVKDYLEQMTEMFTKAGFTNIQTSDSKQAPGLDIHEMGGVRMGKDPKTSMLNKWNQFHNCKNVFVTDGACMTSTSTQNPSLTYMAFAARAANHAVEILKKGEI
jgi:hypothetical protein